MRSIEEIALLLEQNGFNPKEIGFPCFCNESDNRVECWSKALSKFMEICKAEKEGRLVVLPVNVGDVLHYPTPEGICEYCITNIDLNGIAFDNDKGAWIFLKHIGKTVFLTKEEAEKSLKGGAK